MNKIKRREILETIIKITLIGLFFGTFGTTLGGIIGVKLKGTSNKFLSFILSFASRTYDSNYMFRINTRSIANCKFANCPFGDNIRYYNDDSL